MRTLAGWCVRHRRIVVLFWLARPGGLDLLVEAVGTDFSNNFNFPHTQSFDAINLLKSVAPGQSGDTEQVVFGTSGDARLTDPAVGQRINTMVGRDQALPNVSAVDESLRRRRATSSTPPTSTRTARSAGFQVNFDKQTNNISNTEAKTLRRHRHRGPRATA